MPIFEYSCPNCGHRFEKLVLSSKRQRELTCPSCGSPDVQKAISLRGITESRWLRFRFWIPDGG